MVESTTENPLRRLRRRWAEARPFLESSKRRLVLLSVASTAAGFLEAGSLLLLVQLALAISSGDSSVSISTGPLGHTFHITVVGLLLLSVLFAVLRFGLQMVSAYLPARMSADAQANLRLAVFDAFLEASWDVQAREREGHLIEVVVGQVNRSTQAMLILSDAFTAGFNFLALMLSAVILNPLAATSIFISVGLLFVILRPLTMRARKIGAQRSMAYLGISETITEAVRMSEDVQVFDVGDAQRAIVEERSEEVRVPLFRSQFLARMISGLYQTIALLLLVGGLAVVYAVGGTGLVTLGAIVLIMVRGLSYSQTLQGTYHRLNDVAPDMALVRRSLARYRASARTAGSRPLPADPRIRFESVWFEYRTGVPVLSDVSFEIDQGDAVGIIGPSGAGKSTLVQLLLRLRVPTSGRITVNGIDAEEISLSEWRHAVSYVPQDGRLIRGTVAENISFYRDCTMAEVEAAARLAGIHDEILSWPKGYDTMIGQRADAVSGGQRQRLTIARALVRRPSILILDEPTSSLDLHSEAIVQDTLERLKGSVIVVIIAHRLSTLNSCDRLLVFEQGLLKAIGPAHDLLESNEFYRRAVELSQLR